MSRLLYYLRRSIVTVLLIFAIATFLFFAFRLMPGDYATLLADEGASPQDMEKLRAEWGLDQPLYVQYYQYMINMFTGDVGTSHQSHQPVVQFVLPRMMNSLILVLPGLLVAFLLGSLYGAVLGSKPGSALEKYGIFPPTIVGTIPDFFIGIIIIYVFSAYLGLLPSGGIATPETYRETETFWQIYGTSDFWYHYIGPFLAITLKYLYYPALVMRGSVIEVSGQEFHTYQQLVGLKPLMRFKSTLKHASLPIITLLPPVTATSISGLVLIEIVFNWPGIGKLVFDSVLARDTPVIQFVFLLIAIWIVLGNFLVDIAYTVIDPRITYEDHE